MSAFGLWQTLAIALGKYPLGATDIARLMIVLRLFDEVIRLAALLPAAKFQYSKAQCVGIRTDRKVFPYSIL